MSSLQNRAMAPVPEATEDDCSVFMSKNDSMCHFQPGQFIYPCNNAENYAANVSKYCRMNTVQSLWLDFQEIITPEQVSTALWIVSREVPHLQCCLAKRKDKFWIKRMTKFDIDFETSSKEPMEMHAEMLDTTFDMFKGPLWKVRINLSINDLKRCNAKKHSAFLTLCVHHVITDATSNMKICRELIKVLNMLTNGEEVAPQVTPIAPSMNNLITGMKTNSFFLKNACRKIYASILKNFTHESSFNGAISVPKTTSAKASFIFEDFSKSETEVILQMCREALITVNSFLITVANFSLLALAQSHSKVPIGSRKIVSLQAVNMRRYYDTPYKDASGCHISYIEDEFDMSLSDAKNFWAAARKIHLNIKERIEMTKEPIKNMVLVPLSFAIVPINNFLTGRGLQNRTLCHYFTTNMGNLKKLLPGPKVGDNIEITYLLRSAQGPYCGSPFILACHTFREKMTINVDYSANTFTDENARAFLDRLFLDIRKLINCKNLC